MAGRGGSGAVGRLGWVGCVLGALLLACGPVSGEPVAGEEPTARAQGLREAAASGGHREGLVGSEFPVNQPVQRMLETLAGQTFQSGPAAAFDGEQYLVVWTDDRRTVPLFGTGNNVFGARVKRDGTLLDPGGLLLAEPLPGSEQDIRGSTPAVAFDGTRFIVIWEGADDARDAFFTRVRRDGTSLDPEGIRLPAFFGGVGLPPAIACDGAGTCLAVRTNFSEEDEPGPEGFSILGGVLLRGGAVVGTVPIRIADAPAAPRLAAVAWSGREFLVVWEDLRSGEGDIFGARVRRDGTVLDPDGFPITTAPGDQGNPDVAWTGSRFLVVWEDRSGGEGATDVRAARVTSSATVLDGGGFPISTAAGDQTQPHVDDGDGTTLVVWTDTRTGHPRLRGTRVEGDDVLDSSGFTISRSLFTQDSPDVVFGGGRFLVPFAAMREGAETRTVLASRVETDGDVLDDSAIRVMTGAPAQRTPTAAFGGGNYLVAWQDFRDDAGPHIRAARVRPDGSVIEQNGLRLPSAPGASDPAVTFDGRNFLVVWLEPGADADTTAIRAARVSTSGSVLDSGGILIATTLTSAEMRVEVASGGGRSLVVWADALGTPGSGSDVRAARVTRDGAVLDPGGFRVSPLEREQLDPAVAFVGGRFLVVYRDRLLTTPVISDELRATRVTTDGAVLDPAGIFIATGPRTPAIASSGSQALVVWSFNPPGTFELNILGARVTADGSVLDPGGFPVSSAEGSQTSPAVTFDGTRYWVAWEDSRRDSFRLPDLFGARVRTDGTVLDPDGVPLSTERFTEELTPALASDGRGDSALFYSRFVRGRELNNFRIKGRLLE